MRRRGVGWAAAAAWFVGALVLPGGAHASADASLWRDAGRPIASERSRLHQVALRALPAVVSITTVDANASASGTTTEPQIGVGAGFFIHRDGYLLTSAHVVEDAKEVQVAVRSPDGDEREEYVARVLGTDVETDLALLKVDAPHPFPTLSLGSTGHVGVADWVVVIGSPFGLANSVSVGVVSSVARADVAPGGRIAPLDYLQTDAAINPGNSGGPVLDLAGHVVAVANSVNVSGQGIGFAVPIDLAKGVIPELWRHGHVRRGWLGLSVEDAPAAAGVRVSAIVEGGPAQRAGLAVGDIIVRWGRSRLSRAQDLRRVAVIAPIGRRVSFEVLRGQSPLRVSFALGSPPERGIKVVPPATVAKRTTTEIPPPASPR